MDTTHQTAAEAEVLRALTTKRSVFATHVLFRPDKWWLAVRFALGLPTPLRVEDRRVLEEVIFPWYRAELAPRAVLFVGCDWYTRHYGPSFFPDADWWTIDPARRARKFASRQHVVAPLQELDRHFPEDRFDLILCNGVFGYGLNGRDDCEQAFDACRTRLRPGGHLVLGWDDIPARRPLQLGELESLRAFERFTFPPLGGESYATNTSYRHRYDFFRRPQREG